MLDKFYEMNGGCKSTGPNSYKGELGDLLKNRKLADLPIVDFTPIPSGMEGEIDPAVVETLRGDQRYILLISTAVSKGQVGFAGTNLAMMHPGEICEYI